MVGYNLDARVGYMRIVNLIILPILRRGLFDRIVFIIGQWKLDGAATKSRTRDLLITSQLLYHG